MAGDPPCPENPLSPDPRPPDRPPDAGPQQRRGISIRERTVRVVMTTTCVALLLSAVALLLYELQAHRSSWAQDLQMQAELVASASLPALATGDRRLAQENLAMLGVRPQIESAALYDTLGHLFASHALPGVAVPPALLRSPPAQPVLLRDTLQLQQPLQQGGRAMGTLVLRARYDVMPRLAVYLSILALVTLASLALAWMVAQRLQSTITDPILAIAGVAREVVQHRNFALRAGRSSNDEVGDLVDAFNDMLQELAAQSAELRAADQRKDAFLATLAHELRNPLAPVSTALSILARGDADAATQARLVAMMQRQMQQFVRLIDDLMEVSRISTGRLVLRQEQLDLVQVLRSAVEAVAPLLLERRHALQVQWPPPVWVQGDRTRLGQVFVNLLANAAKYTEPGGRIEIGFALEPERVHVHVSDNGQGIALEMQREVFEMFVQVERGQAGGRGGLGVGLPLARQLVQMHGGRLTLVSGGLGTGSTFSVELPRLAAAPEAEPPGSPEGLPAAAPEAVHLAQPLPQPSPLQLLLADDNRDFADSLAAVLKTAGHRVEVAYDGRAALRLAQDRLPDVGLFDLGMPGLDGYALASAVRALPGGRLLLLVAVTGWGQLGDQRRARAAGYDEHMVKPIDMDALLAMLEGRRLLQARGAERVDAGEAST